jgi:pyrimidine deaminase RibD-like protein
MPREGEARPRLQLGAPVVVQMKTIGISFHMGVGETFAESAATAISGRDSDLLAQTSL